MDYRRHYDRLMERARDRVLVGYSERHHIIPRCLDGSNDVSNIVRLTPEEHYVAHLLLVKMYPGDHRLLWAAVQMVGGSSRMERRNKAYGWLRRRFAQMARVRGTGRKHTAAAKAKMSASKTGLKRGPHSAETKAKMSAAAKGRKKSAAHCAALSVARTGKTIAPCSETRKANISAALKASPKLRASQAVKYTPEYRANHSIVMTQWHAARRARAAERRS